MKFLMVSLAASAFFLLSPKLFAAYSLNYSTNGSIITVTGYTGTPVSVAIPNGVTTVGGNAFDSCATLTNVTFAATVNTIDPYAFAYCNGLTNLTFPNGITNIQLQAFYNCGSLTNVSLGSGVASLGQQAFDGCAKLKTITVNSLNPNFSSVNGIVFDKSQTTLVQYPGGLSGSYTVSNNVTGIGLLAFGYCSGLTSVTLSTNLTVIGPDAFFYCTGLTGVTIPNSVTSIATGTFTGCNKLTSINVGAQNPNYSSLNGVLFDKNQTTLLECPGGFSGGYTLPPGVTSIGDFAFEYCQSLTAAVLPGSVTSIGLLAFFECNNLTSINIPEGVTSIGQETFDVCTSLRSITIPDSVTSLGDYAFMYCSDLTTVIVGSGVASIGEDAFAYGDLTSIYFEGNAPTADLSAFDGDATTAYYLYGSTGWDTFSSATGIPAVLLDPPVSTAMGFGVQGSKFGFSINGPANATVVVQGCTNLANPVWVPVQTNILGVGSFNFSDPAFTNSPARYYRIAYPLP